MQRLRVVCVVVLRQLSLVHAISQPTIQKVVQAVRARDVITVGGILSESVWHTPALNWTFTPKLSLQMYIQPLISVGTYTAIKELARPRSYEFLTYGSGVSTIRKGNNEYVIDPDPTGPAQPFSIADPDFNFKSLRGSAVLRWEYLPGSTIYFVWTQLRTDESDPGTFRFGRNVSQLFRSQPDNIFLIKLRFWTNP